jgi:photosystem II stability/assembly factor-like uncharacterized protein
LNIIPALLPLFFAASTNSAVPVPEGTALTEDHVREFSWRSIGPANMGGRLTDLAVDPSRHSTFYAASASGGLFKTTSNGTTFEPVFEDEGSSSIGAVAIAPSAPETVWVGTGEANARNSVSWGDGVYRSDDGGETWSHRGLRLSRHIGGIAIHPTVSETVFVAAMGSTWGPDPERGLYRTEDGGESWKRVLFVDENTGCIDVRIDSARPEIVYAATYQRQRDEFDSNDPAIRTGPGSGLWRSTDGGNSWERLSGGLPTVPMGRIGIDIYEADPRVLFAIIETDRTGERGAPPRSDDRVSLGIRGRDDEAGGFHVDSVTEGESAAQAGLQPGDVITRIDDVTVSGRGELVAALAEYGPGDDAQLEFTRDEEVLTGTLHLLGRLMRSRARSFAGSQGGQVANAQDDQGEDGFETGGIYRSDDRGTTWTRVNSLNPRPFYYSQIRVDPRDEQRLYVLGISLHHSTDGGKKFGTTRRGAHPDHHAMWIDPTDGEHLLLGNDGGIYVSWDDSETWDHLDVLPIAQFYGIAVDRRIPYRVYGGLQDNGSWGGPSATRSRGIAVSDWITINGGDGFRCAVDPIDPDIVYSESQNGAIARLDLRTGERRRIAPADRGGRFNWNTPFFLSPHNSAIVFFAGEAVFRSIDGGEHSSRISPEISRTEHGTATALAQSPRDEEVLYVGTDDGALWRTLDGGGAWEDIGASLPGVEQPLYVSDIEPSPHRTETVFLTLDGHRSNDFAPHVFVSEDSGTTWRSIREGLPEGSVRTIAVDPVNSDLLFVGTEFGCFISIDQGEHWTPFGTDLPTVPVHDLVIHPDEADLIAGTHGRGIYIADIAPLQHLRRDTLGEEPHLFPVQATRSWNSPPEATVSGAGRFLGQNPARGAAIYYYLPEDLDEPVQLSVRDATGRRLRDLEGSAEAGLHLVRWDLRAQRGGRGGGQRQGFSRGGGGVSPGDYSVTLELGEEPSARVVRVLPDPLTSASGYGIVR